MRGSTVHWLLLNLVLSVSWKRICLSWFSLGRILFVTEEEAGSSRVLPFSLGGHFTQIRQCWKCSSFAQFAIKIFSRKLGEKFWNYSHIIILLDNSKLSIYTYFGDECTTTGSTNAINTLKTVNFTPVSSSAVVNIMFYSFIFVHMSSAWFQSCVSCGSGWKDRYLFMLSSIPTPHSLSEVWSVHSWAHFRAENKCNGISEQGCQWNGQQMKMVLEAAVHLQGALPALGNQPFHQCHLQPCQALPSSVQDISCSEGPASYMMNYTINL